MNDPTNNPSGWQPRTVVAAKERAILRALLDLPAFAEQVIRVAQEDYFEVPATAMAYSLMEEGYRQHGVVPDPSILYVMNDGASHTTEASVQAVADVIRQLESMTPIPAVQLPAHLATTEDWLRERMVYTTHGRILRAKEDGIDPRPLTDELRAAYDWSFNSAVKGRFALKTREDLLNAPTTPFLAQNLLVQNSLAALVSPPGCNKTFVALDLALSVASGQTSWLNQPLHLSGPVVYVLGEGAGLFKLRVQAWDQAHGVTGSYPFHYINEAVALTNRADTTAFVAQVASLKPVLVVFDTLSRCLAGADENSQKDMSAAVSACDTMRQRLGCCVLLLHHTTKDGSTERGSSVLKGAVDTLVVLKVPDAKKPHFSMTCDKQKDAQPFEPLTLIRESVMLAGATDSHTGQPASSCVIRVATRAQVKQHDDGLLYRAQKFMASHPGSSRTEVAAHLGGRNEDRMRMIKDWETKGELQFPRRKRRAASVFDVSDTSLDADEAVA